MEGINPQRRIVLWQPPAYARGTREKSPHGRQCHIAGPRRLVVAQNAKLRLAFRVITEDEEKVPIYSCKQTAGIRLCDEFSLLQFIIR